MFQVIRTRNKEIMDVESCFLSTTLQIWCYCGHVIKSRTMRHLNFGCQLNLSKSHKSLVMISCVVSAQCRKVWLGGEKNAPPPCEIGLIVDMFKSFKDLPQCSWPLHYEIVRDFQSTPLKVQKTLKIGLK